MVYSKVEVEKFCRKLIIFLLVALIVWTNIHEIFHMLALKIEGFRFIYHWNLAVPQVECLDCQSATFNQIFYYAFAPYFVNFIAIIIGAVFYTRKWIKYLLHFGYFDIFSNFVTLLFVGRNSPHDFIIITKVRFSYTIIILFLLSTIIWIYVTFLLHYNKRNINRLLQTKREKYTADKK